MFRTATDWLGVYREQVNALNVYPVPDGDTGTNMYLTVAAAREAVQDPRPFSTRRFRTDGRTIFLDTLKATGESELLDLKRGQFVIKSVIERTFKDLDLDNEVVARWRPFRGKDTIVIDPQRAFGQPIAAAYGVPTVALAEAVTSEGSVERVSRLYEIPSAIVRDAVRFEADLQAA